MVTRQVRLYWGLGAQFLSGSDLFPDLGPRLMRKTEPHLGALCTLPPGMGSPRFRSAVSVAGGPLGWVWEGREAYGEAGLTAKRAAVLS